MPKTLFNLLNPFSVRKQYNAVNKYAYSENVNYINPPDGQLKPMPGNREVYDDATTQLDKVGDVVPLDEENMYVCRGNNTIIEIDTTEDSATLSTSVTLTNEQAPTASDFPGRTTAGSDGENVYFANGPNKPPLWYGKGLIRHIWDASAPGTGYALENATLITPAELNPRLRLIQYRHGDWPQGMHPTLTDIGSDPLNPPDTADETGFYRQRMRALYHDQGSSRSEVGLADILDKSMITSPSRGYGNLGLKKYWFGISLVYDGYQETTISPLRIFPTQDLTFPTGTRTELRWEPFGSGNGFRKRVYHFIESQDEEISALWNGEQITRNDATFSAADTGGNPHTRVYYAGFGRKPLEPVQITNEGIDWISGSSVSGFYFRLEIPDRDDVPNRVTGCKIYTRYTATEQPDDEEQGTGDWFLVQDINFDHTKPTDENRTSTFTSIREFESNFHADTTTDADELRFFFNFMGVERGTYQQSSGITAEYESMDVRYGLCAAVNGRLVVADVKHPGSIPTELVGNVNELLISEYDRFSVFDYAFKKIKLKHRPTAMIGYGGDLLVFEEGHTYLIDMSIYEIREEWEGIGASGPESIAITDRGLFFANKQNIYWSTRGLVEAIGNEIWDIAEYPENGFKNLHDGTTPTVTYNAVFDCAMIFWSRADDKCVGAMFSPTIRDWVTHIVLDGSHPYKLFAAYDGKNYLLWAGDAGASHQIHEMFTQLDDLLDMIVEAKLTQIGNVKFRLYSFTVDTQEQVRGNADAADNSTISVKVKLENAQGQPMTADHPTENMKRWTWNNPQGTKTWLTDVQFIITVNDPAEDTTIKNVYSVVRPQQIENRTVNV